MITAILGILSSSGLGAIIGLIGSWLTKKEEAKNLKIKYDYETKMAEIRKAEAQLEFSHELAMADKQTERAEKEALIERDIAEVEAFKESLKEQQKIYKSRFIEALRGLMRPVITIYLLIIATYIAFRINLYVGGMEIALTYQEMLVIYKDIIMQIMFLVTTAVTWWFGSRPSSIRKK